MSHDRLPPTGGRGAPLLHRLSAGLVVSVQPVDGGPMDDDDTVVRMARAAVDGGAAGLRIEGAARVAAVRRAVTVPIVGIVKRDLPGFSVRITPGLEDVQALLAAGADIVALDATMRDRPVPVADLLGAVHRGGALAMADASNAQDGLAALALGFEIIGTTLSGYTEASVPEEPDLALVAVLAGAGAWVMAEGRYQTPQQVAAARAAGARAVTVGSALTRLELATAKLAAAVRAGP